MSFFFWAYVKPAIEVITLWWIFYRILVFFEGTRAFHVMKGIIVLVIAFLLSQFFALDTLKLLLTKLFGISIIGLLIIFQQELRLGLARLGQQHLFAVTLEESEIIAVIEGLAAAVYKLAEKKVGCLIALERETKLKPYVESGVMLDAKISAELIQGIFMPGSPLHDGGVIAHADRVIAASCLFPLSENPRFSKIIGTRHRAALGLTEQTDAVVIMVSEETGEISFAAEGRFIPVTARERFVQTLKGFFILPPKKKTKEPAEA